MQIRIAQIKTQPAKGDLDANHSVLMTLLREIGGEKADVVVTPECFLDGYVATEPSVTPADLRRYAIDPSGSQYTRAVAGWARENKTWVIFACSRLIESGVCNSALVYDRTARLVGWYDKTHCQTHDGKFVPGKALSVFESDFGPFGVVICADRRWPETIRSLALQGARIVFNPTYGMHNDLNLAMMRTRSYESEVFIAFTHPQQALITDPYGEVAHNETSDAVRWTVCTVDLSAADRARSTPSAHLRDRRPELYVPFAPPRKTTLDKWKDRAAELRAALPVVLFGGPIPEPPRPAHRVVAEGEDAFCYLDARLEELKRLYPDETRKSYYPLYQFKHPRRAKWTTQIIEYAGWPGHPPVRAVLRIPCVTEPTAAVLCLHGHSKGLQFGCAEMNYLAEPLTDAGFVTLSPDAVPFGDRRLHARDEWEAQSAGNYFVDERVLASECWLLGQTLLGRQIWELMCAVDLICTLPQVDAQRIGSIGCSQGGVHTWWLAALDPRIAAAVASAGVSTYRDWIQQRAINALSSYLPGILKLADQDELVALIAPRPLLLCNCAKDIYFPLDGIESVVGFVGKVYEKLGASQNFRHDLDPSEHGFPEWQQKLALDWLQQHLRPRRSAKQ